MFRWLSKLRSGAGQRSARDVLLNDGLELAMDWGEAWLTPVQDRLLQRHRYLSREELDELNAICQSAMRLGHDAAYQMVHERGTNIGQQDFIDLVRAAHPWLNAENAARLFSQSMYYTWKAGGPPLTSKEGSPFKA